MNPERAAALDDALEAVRERGLDPDSPGGAAALQFLLGSAPAAPATHEPPAGRQSAPTAGDASEGPSARDKLAVWTGVTPPQIGDIFEIGADSVTVDVPSTRLPSSKADRQRILVLLQAAAERIAFDHEVVTARAVNAIADHYGVLDQNMNKNISRWSHLLTRRGRRGAYTYRVTQPGLERAADVVRFLAREQGVVQV